MTVLQAGIESSGAQRGAQTFNQAAEQIKRDAAGITQGIQDQDESLDDLSAGFGRFKGVIVGLGLGLLAAQFIETADAMTLVSGRLKLVTDSQQELLATRNDLFDLAQETRQGFENLVDVYGRFARSTRELDLEQGELLESTELIAKSVITSGATATEANAALIQLSQGFAAGALRGEEFRSVSEQLPAILDSISKGLGVTRGELREMAFEGQLTAGRFFEALGRQADQIRADFEEMPGTVSQGATRMQNSLASLIARINETSGAGERLFEIFSGIAGLFDSLGKNFIPTATEELAQLLDLQRRRTTPEQLGFLERLGFELEPIFGAPGFDVDEDLQRRIDELRRQIQIESRAQRRGQRPEELQFGLPPLPGRRADIPDEDFAKILDRNARADKKIAEERLKAEEDLADSRRRSAAVQAEADERVRQGRIDLLEATLELEEREQSLADQITDRNLTAQERYNESVAELLALQHRVSDETFSRELERLNEELREADPLFSAIINRADQFATAFSSAVADAVVGTERWSEALDRVAASILQIAINIAIEESIRNIFRAVASSLTTPETASITRTSTTISSGGGATSSPNVIQSAGARSAAPVGGGGTPSVNVSIQNSGAPADVDRVEVARADPDQVDMTVFIRAAAQNVSQNGELGRSIGQSFNLRRQGKQV